MRFHAGSIDWLWGRKGEAIALLGFATGRVSYEPEAKWLYSFRLFLVLMKIEVLWETGHVRCRVCGNKTLTGADRCYACIEAGRGETAMDAPETDFPR